MNLRSYGQIAYEAYAAHRGGVSVRGERLPSWHEQDRAIRLAWEEAADEVRAEIRNRVEQGGAELG